ncbi:TPA: ATP-binding protein [Streptococcus suis]
MVEKINFNFQYPPGTRERAEETRKRLLNSPEVKRLKDIYGIDDDFLSQPIQYSAIREREELEKKYGLPVDLFFVNGVLATSVRMSAEQIARANDKVVTRLVTDSITRQYRNISLHEITVNNSNRPILAKFADYLDKYSYHSDQQGVWLCGNKGIGKSTLMGGMANELVMTKNAEVVLLSVGDMVNKWFELSRFDTKRFNSEINHLKQCEVLMLDDIGAETLTEWTITILYNILDTRMNTKRKTWFTSNLTIGEYIKLLMTKTTSMNAERMQTRLTTMAAQLKMDGENLRKMATI